MEYAQIAQSNPKSIILHIEDRSIKHLLLSLFSEQSLFSLKVDQELAHLASEAPNETRAEISCFIYCSL